MSYEKNKWAAYNPDIPDEEQPEAFITLGKMNNIEKGIEEAHKLAEETSASEGAVGPEGPMGPAGEKGDKGEDGVTPVKGVDYFTEEEVTSIANEVIETVSPKDEPYYLEEEDFLFACGVHVDVYAAEESGKVKVVYKYDGQDKEIIIPETAGIAGGGYGKERPVYYPHTSITLYSGKLRTICGGNMGNGSVGVATMVINGGEFNTNNGPCGGGISLGAGENNKVGSALIVLNNANADVVYGGHGSGLGTVGQCKVIMNGGTVKWLTAGGSNGHASVTELEINGGKMTVVQGCNRGTVQNIKITVNGGEIERLYAGGETEDTGVTATYDKSAVVINGGTIGKAEAGTDGGVASADKVSGTYVDGTITDEAGTAMNLVKTVSTDQLLERITVLETK